MNRLLQIILIYVLYTGTAYAQSDAQINVNLAPIHAIEVNSYVLNSIGVHQEEAVPVTSPIHQSDQIRMSSTSGFVINIMAENLIAPAIDFIIPSVIISPQPGVINPLWEAQLTSIALSRKATTIIQNNSGAIHNTFDIHYRASDECDRDLPEPRSLMITAVIYCVEAQ